MFNLSPASGPVSKPTAFESTKDALRVGLSAQRARLGGGRQLNETTLQPNVGAELPARRLGGTRRRHFPKGGTSLRKDIQDLERAAEKTLMGLSRKGMSEDDVTEFRYVLADALKRKILGGSMKDAVMHASLLESRFIGAMSHEGSGTLTSMNDLGAEFRSKIQESSSLVDQIANQLSGGTPVNVVLNNIKASFASTNRPGPRATLTKAYNIVSEF
jgi:hypothetical protein